MLHVDDENFTVVKEVDQKRKKFEKSMIQKRDRENNNCTQIYVINFFKKEKNKIYYY